MDERGPDSDETAVRPPARPQAAAGDRPGAAAGRSDEGFAQSQRQRTIDSLCEAFANDEIEVEDFERRVEAAHRAVTAQELRRLLDDLPSGRLPVKAEDPAHPEPVPAAAGQQLRRHVGDVREWGFTVGIMGGMSRQGYWVPAEHNVAIGLMGGCSLDFREAAFPPGETEVHVLAFWGGVEIIVPPWLRVEVSGIGLMGGFDHVQNAAPPADPHAPVLRISGVAIMGGVGIEVRLPGESGKDARRRAKEGKKLREGKKDERKRLKGSKSRRPRGEDDDPEDEGW